MPSPLQFRSPRRSSRRLGRRSRRPRLRLSNDPSACLSASTLRHGQRTNWSVSFPPRANYVPSASVLTSHSITLCTHSPPSAVSETGRPRNFAQARPRSLHRPLRWHHTRQSPLVARCPRRLICSAPRPPSTGPSPPPARPVKLPLAPRRPTLSSPRHYQRRSKRRSPLSRSHNRRYRKPAIQGTHRSTCSPPLTTQATTTGAEERASE